MCENKPKRQGHHASTIDTGDPYLNLWAAVVRQAIEEARAGDSAAAVWLWAVAPTVARRALANIVEVSEGEQTFSVR